MLSTSEWPAERDENQGQQSSVMVPLHLSLQPVTSENALMYVCGMWKEGERRKQKSASVSLQSAKDTAQGRGNTSFPVVGPNRVFTRQHCLQGWSVNRMDWILQVREVFQIKHV